MPGAQATSLGKRRRGAMPRKSRTATVVPGALIHVIVRFVDGRFQMTESGRRRYLTFLGEGLAGTDWGLLSYALMSSHIHLAFLAGEAPFSAWAHRVHTRFAMWISWRRRRQEPKTLGHILGDRPSTYVLSPDRAATTIAYHHQNPREAGLVQCPSESTWTSHRAYLGLADPQAGLDVSLGLRLSGFEDSERGRADFHRWVSRVVPSLSWEPVSQPPTPTEIVAVALELLGHAPSIFLGPRTRDATLARRVVLRAAQLFGCSLRRVAPLIRTSASAASRLLSRPHDHILVDARTTQLVAVFRANTLVESTVKPRP